jgi:hypothetical protein
MKLKQIQITEGSMVFYLDKAKPTGRVPGSTRIGGELFDRSKYDRTRKYPDFYDYKICRTCGQVRDRDQLIDMGREGWCCVDCKANMGSVAE